MKKESVKQAFLRRKKKLPLKTVYYLSFLFFIVIPILAVLIIALITLHRQFKQQALENVRQAQETVMIIVIYLIQNNLIHGVILKDRRKDA